MTRWRLRAAFAVLLAVAVNVLLSILSHHHDAVVVTLMVFTAVAATGLLLDALGSAESAAWSSVLETTATPEREDGRLASYRHLLERHRYAREADTALQMRLLALADQRIAQVYGVRLATDPQRAHTLLGPELGGLADATAAGHALRLTGTQIERLIDRIEIL